MSELPANEDSTHTVNEAGNTTIRRAAPPLDARAASQTVRNISGDFAFFKTMIEV